MKTKLFVIAGCALLLSPLGAEDAQPKGERPKGPGGPGGPGAPGGKGEFFKSMDKDGDKAISKAEAGERWQGLGRLDKNGDEKLTMEELAAGRPGGPGEGGAPKGGPGGPQAGRGEFFKNADKNNDGKISKDEVPAEAWERMGKLDKDADGAVSREEMAAMMAGRGGPGGGPGRPGAGGPGGGPMEMFSRYDTDKDGKLSKSEAPAELWERLSKADENADGLVSKEELESVFKRDGKGGPGGAPGKGAPKPAPAEAKASA